MPSSIERCSGSDEAEGCGYGRRNRYTKAAGHNELRVARSACLPMRWQCCAAGFDDLTIYVARRPSGASQGAPLGRNLTSFHLV